MCFFFDLLYCTIKHVYCNIKNDMAMVPHKLVQTLTKLKCLRLE